MKHKYKIGQILFDKMSNGHIGEIGVIEKIDINKAFGKIYKIKWFLNIKVRDGPYSYDYTEDFINEICEIITEDEIPDRLMVEAL